MIPVTKLFLPPMEDDEDYLKSIWQKDWLTNMGPLASQLEMDLKSFLEVSYLLFVTNSIIALQMAVKTLNIIGEVILRPFSFVVATSSIVWKGCVPVYVDIDKDSLCIDSIKIENVVSKRTLAILVTQVFGNPCDAEQIDRIAKKHNVKVIYDEVYAFCIEINGKSVFEYGDISTCSLHVAKLYHNIEGGLLIIKESSVLAKLAYES